MGGALSSIQALNQKSQLDQVIEDNFQTHLWLTLLTNIHLFNKYPDYLTLIEDGQNPAVQTNYNSNQIATSQTNKQLAKQS